MSTQCSIIDGYRGCTCHRCLIPDLKSLDLYPASVLQVRTTMRARVLLPALLVVLTCSSVALAAPRLLAHHKGRTTLKLSGNTRLTLSQGCLSLPVGQGRAWKVRTRAGAQIASGMIRKADLVLAMTEGHVQAARALAGPDDGDKIERLDPADDIEDPIGLDQSAYDSLARRLTEIIPPRLKEHFGRP